MCYITFDLWTTDKKINDQYHFGFDWPTKEAKEVFQDPAGRWISFNVMNESLVLLEKKNLPEHLLGIENLETPVTLQSMIADLQDAGEVSWLYLLLEFENTNQNCEGTTSKLWRKHQSKLWLFPEAKLEVSHHKLQDDKCTNVKPIVFIMDDPPQPKVKKQKKTKDSVSITTKNFGSWINVSKIKTCSDTFKIGWRCRFLDNCFVFGLERISVSLDFMNIYWGLIHTSSICKRFPIFPCCRLDCSSTEGLKVITPLRPILCLGTQIDVKEETLRLMWITWFTANPCCGNHCHHFEECENLRKQTLKWVWVFGINIFLEKTFGLVSRFFFWSVWTLAASVRTTYVSLGFMIWY